jgi:hypothetical protein
MVTRVFYFNQGLPATIAAISGTDCAWYFDPLAIYVASWDTLNTLTKATITTTLTAAGYTFDHDDP